ncbi:hypothetical protein NUW58_g2136 [Xylaria curta]|uniref:Uncharacterized protein n=1 Tax=Xylaria curta TaxID=42375 RepID=A0ACC1PIM4_9PEZI|nr:hypothetical protein NUW58_g2136 [Xylaria curta]
MAMIGIIEYVSWFGIAMKDPQISRHSSSSGAFSTTSSLDNELSQLVIEGDDPPSPQLPRARSHRSSSSEAFSLSSSLNNELSQLVIDHDQPSSSQLVTSGGYHSPQRYVPSEPPPRPATAASDYSSSGESLGSVPDSLDDVFSQLVIEKAIPPSSKSTAQATQPTRLMIPYTQRKQFAGPSVPTSPVREPDEASPVYSSLPSIESPVFGSPSSTGKLSNYFPSRSQSPAQSVPHSTPSTPVRTPRLYRTRSGNLVSHTELRQRKEREDEALDIVLKGIGVLGGAQIPLRRRSITMTLNESGRWRIDSIWEPWGGP